MYKKPFVVQQSILLSVWKTRLLKKQIIPASCRSKIVLKLFILKISKIIKKLYLRILKDYYQIFMLTFHKYIPANVNSV